MAWRDHHGDVWLQLWPAAASGPQILHLYSKSVGLDLKDPFCSWSFAKNVNILWESMNIENEDIYLSHCRHNSDQRWKESGNGLKLPCFKVSEHSQRWSQETWLDICFYESLWGFGGVTCPLMVISFYVKWALYYLHTSLYEMFLLND